WMAHVRFGSEADICSAKRHVRFTPNSDRESRLPPKVMSALPPESRHVQCTSRCLLRAKSGHRPLYVPNLASGAFRPDVSSSHARLIVHRQRTLELQDKLGRGA